MSWERAALEQAIRLLVKSDQEHGNLYKRLSELGIELNIDGTGYKILDELAEFKFLSENLDALEENAMTEEEFLKFYMNELKESYDK